MVGTRAGLCYAQQLCTDAEPGTKTGYKLLILQEVMEAAGIEPASY